MSALVSNDVAYGPCADDYDCALGKGTAWPALVYMMNIPVDNEHAVDTKMFVLRRVERRLRRYRDIIEKAEAHRAATFCMVTWWPHDGQAVVDLATAHAQCQINCSTRSKKSAAE